MPRVVPSEVVEFIDDLYPAVRSGQPGVSFGAGHSPALQALVRLVDEIPEELLAVTGKDYIDLALGVEAIKTTLDFWTSRGTGGTVPGMKGYQTAVHGIRAILTKCPDQAPRPTTSSVLFVTPGELRDSIRLDISAAYAGLHAGEWKTTTVLAGCAIEALLLWAIEQRLASGTPKPASAPPKAQPEDWHLPQYITVAADMGLLGTQTVTIAREMKEFRNLIHPGAAKRRSMNCSRGTAHAALSALDLVVDDLTKTFPPPP